MKVALLETLRVQDVMSKALVLLGIETTLAEAWRELHTAGVSGAPVLNARGRVVGILSMSDLADPRRLASEAVSVGEVMTRVVYAVRVTDPVRYAVKLMLHEHIHRAVAVNEDGSLAGLVVPMDVLRALDRAHEEDLEKVRFVDLERGV